MATKKSTMSLRSGDIVGLNMPGYPREARFIGLRKVSPTVSAVFFSYAGGQFRLNAKNTQQWAIVRPSTRLNPKYLR